MHIIMRGRPVIIVVPGCKRTWARLQLAEYLAQAPTWLHKGQTDIVIPIISDTGHLNKITGDHRDALLTTLILSSG